MHEQDVMLAAAIATMDDAVSTPDAAPVSTRRTVIAEAPTDIPEGAVRVNIGRHTFDVPDAPTYGHAVLVALAMAKRDGIAGVMAEVFMWNYSVTDAAGKVLRGPDRAMRDSLESARIAASLRR